MDLNQASGTTTAFYTLHSCDGEIALQISEILLLTNKAKNEAWMQLIRNNPSLEQRLINQGLSKPVNLETITWDDSMLLFLCSINVDEEGKPIGIGESLKREKFGRFPFNDGSITNYLIEFLRPNVKVKNSNDVFDSIVQLLRKLSSFNHSDDYSEARFSGGMGGMNILGFLSLEEVIELRRLLSGRNWSVASDEPLDGGVRDAIKHVLAMLRAAERIDSGVIHRAHL
tara:strand:+ start:456 stop:1139 length:684 start_codon:yes stop_codon:yes gene_type:complete